MLAVLHTLDDLPCVVITDLPTGPLLEEVKLCPADDAVSIKVHPVEHLCQRFSVVTVCGGEGVCVWRYVCL